MCCRRTEKCSDLAPSLSNETKGPWILWHSWICLFSVKLPWKNSCNCKQAQNFLEFQHMRNIVEFLTFNQRYQYYKSKFTELNLWSIVACWIIKPMCSCLLRSIRRCVLNITGLRGKTVLTAVGSHYRLPWSHCETYTGTLQNLMVVCRYRSQWITVGHKHTILLRDLDQSSWRSASWMAFWYV